MYVCRKLVNDSNVDVIVSISVSPPLCSMHEVTHFHFAACVAIFVQTIDARTSMHVKRRCCANKGNCIWSTILQGKAILGLGQPWLMILI